MNVNTLDRAYQRELLEKCSKYYPEPCEEIDPKKLNEEEKQRYISNMWYLEEHGLVKSGLHRTLSGYGFVPPSITATGLDFLADDGGISAILGTVTIRIHDDTLKQMIEARILSADVTQEDKNRMISELRSLPAAAIKHLTMKLLDLGLDYAPRALPLIETFLSQSQKVGLG